MRELVFVCVGGAVGSGARFLMGTWVTRAVGPGFPWGTLSINVLGCFALEVVLGFATRAAGLPANLRLLLTTGLMGGFTTYSTFNAETSHLLRTGAWAQAGAYIGATVAGGLFAGLAGAAAGRALAGP